MATPPPEAAMAANAADVAGSRGSAAIHAGSGAPAPSAVRGRRIWPIRRQPRHFRRGGPSRPSSALPGTVAAAAPPPSASSDAPPPDSAAAGTLNNARAHDVVEVTQGGYRNCSASSPVSAALRTGNDAVLLGGGASRRSSRYFICSTPGHCDAGMKLEVRISSRTPSAPTGCRRRRGQGCTICSGSPPVVITTPGVVSYGAAPRSSSAGPLYLPVATVVMVSLLLGLAIA